MWSSRINRQPIAGDLQTNGEDKFTQAVSRVYSRFTQGYSSSCFQNTSKIFGSHKNQSILKAISDKKVAFYHSL